MCYVGDAGLCQGVVVRGFDGVHSADAGPSSVGAMIRFSYLLSQALLGASVLQGRLANFYDQREAIVDNWRQGLISRCLMMELTGSGVFYG